MTPSNGATNALIELLLVQHLQLGLLCHHIGLCYRDTSLLRLQGLNVGGALLRGQPALLHQRTVAIPGHLGEFAVCLRLLQGCLELAERRLGLRNLVIEFRCHDFGQQLAGLHPVADVDFALVDITAGARKDIGDRERRCGRRQIDDFDAGAGSYRRNTDLGDKVPALPRRRNHLAVLLVVAPRSGSQRCRQNERKPDTRNPANPSPVAGVQICGLDLMVSLRRLEIQRTIEVHSSTSSNTP